ncbi:hypothetical protein T484DRAFT_1905432 [Baffinella frigidus]|nr:hypothetical protein T484DRAFT_1905432 [Cryptophyta sp. CCMP2293]
MRVATLSATPTHVTASPKHHTKTFHVPLKASFLAGTNGRTLDRDILCPCAVPDDELSSSTWSRDSNDILDTNDSLVTPTTASAVAPLARAPRAHLPSARIRILWVPPHLAFVQRYLPERSSTASSPPLGENRNRKDLLAEVEFESIRKKLARAADTEHSN